MPNAKANFRTNQRSRLPIRYSLQQSLLSPTIHCSRHTTILLSHFLPRDKGEGLRSFICTIKQGQVFCHSLYSKVQSTSNHRRDRGPYQCTFPPSSKEGASIRIRKGQDCLNYFPVWTEVPPSACDAYPLAGSSTSRTEGATNPVESSKIPRQTTKILTAVGTSGK